MSHDYSIVMDEPEVVLFGAIIRQAIIEAVRGTLGGAQLQPTTREIYERTAREWFDSRDFVELCHLFNADHDAIREASLRTIKLNRRVRLRQINWQA